MAAFVVQLLAGLSHAGSLFLVAAGLTLIFGSLRVINVAHGSFYMYAAFLVTTIAASAAGSAGIWAALALAPLVIAGLGVVAEVVLMRRLYGREHLAQLLATFGLFYVLADLGITFWGTNQRSVGPPSSLGGRVAVLGQPFPVYSLFVIVVAIVVGAALAVLLRKTVLGWRIRAALGDTELLTTTGTNVSRIYTLTFALGALLAGIAGAVTAPTQTVAPGLDQSILVDAFIVSIVGGIGSISGSAVAAVIIGVVGALGIRWAPNFAPVAEYVVMIVILALRPEGLFGRKEAAALA